jgi:predicted  nucleic acid-binding Zn-ribbon protein
MKTVEDKLDLIQEDIGEIKSHLAVYNEQLRIHIKRSEAIEKKLEIDVNKIEEQIAPIKSHVELVRAVFLTLCALASIVLGLQQLGAFSSLK